MTARLGRPRGASSRRRHDLETVGLAIGILLVLAVLAAIDAAWPGLL